MPLECNYPVEFLTPPQTPSELFSSTSDAIREPPFLLQGSPSLTRPQSYANVLLWSRKSTARNDLNNMESYFAEDNYTSTTTPTEHILQQDSNTTLRYDGIQFTHSFTAIHKNIWSQNAPLQVSIVFKSQNNQFFHITIPVEFQTNTSFENEYLSQWLYDTPPSMPTKFGINLLLNFKENTNAIQFLTLQYCLSTKNQTLNSPYILCYFNNSLKLDPSKCQSWLRNDVRFDSTSENTNRLRTFASIFSLLYKGSIIGKYVGNQQDPYLINDRDFFSTSSFTTVIKPSYYTVSVDQLLASFKPVAIPKAGKRLQNMKCFPLNMASQIDDQGNIVIDETTNKPIDLAEVDPSKFGDERPSYDKLLEEDRKNKNLVFTITVSIISVLVIALIITLGIWLMKGRPSTGSRVSEGGLTPGLGGSVVGGLSLFQWGKSLFPGSSKVAPAPPASSAQTGASSAQTGAGATPPASSTQTGASSAQTGASSAQTSAPLPSSGQTGASSAQGGASSVQGGASSAQTGASSAQTGAGATPPASSVNPSIYTKAQQIALQGTQAVGIRLKDLQRRAEEVTGRAKRLTEKQQMLKGFTGSK